MTAGVGTAWRRSQRRRRRRRRSRCCRRRIVFGSGQWSTLEMKKRREMLRAPNFFRSFGVTSLTRTRSY